MNMRRLVLPAALVAGLGFASASEAQASPVAPSARVTSANLGGVHVRGTRTRHTAAFAARRRIHLGERTVVGGATVVAAHLIRNNCRDRKIDIHVVTTVVRARPLA